jgi:DHA2 family multidrug resistance protein
LSAAAKGAPRLGGSIGWITFATMAAAFMALADISIVNVNLPQMQASFGVEVDQLGWISTAYMIANVVAMPMTGWLQKRLGLRTSFVLSLVTFTAGSALCGSAWSFEALIAFRVIQGLGGGGLLPLSQGILLARYPVEKFELAGALFGIGAMLGPVIGPFFGAELLEVVAWPWIFWINVPIGTVATIAAFRTIDEKGFAPSRRPFDARGALLLATALASMQFVLEEGNRRDWFESIIVIVATLVSVGSFVGLGFHLSRAKTPIVDVSVFRSARLAAATAYNFALGAWMIAGGFLNALYFSNVLGLPPLRIGELLLVGNLSDFVVIPLSAWLLKKIGGAPLIVAGVLLISAGFWMNALLGLDASFWDLVVPQLVRSGGASLLYVPVTIVAFDRLSDDDRESAVGLFNLTRELGGSIAVALSAHLLIQRTAIHTEALASVANRAVLHLDQLWIARRLVARDAFADVFTAGAVLVLGFVPLVLWLGGRVSEAAPALSGGARSASIHPAPFISQ